MFLGIILYENDSLRDNEAAHCNRLGRITNKTINKPNIDQASYNKLP